MNRNVDLNDPLARDVFCAALTGICANPYFFGATHQGQAASAVEFAFDCLAETIRPLTPAELEIIKAEGSPTIMPNNGTKP